MSLINGSLCAGMQNYHHAGHKLAVLVIDEQFSVPSKVLAAQQQVLNTAQQLGFEVWHVELNTTLNSVRPEPNDPTNAGLAVPGAKILTKPYLNAFASDAQPNLHQQLQLASISMLVVMGFAVNCCVRLTCVGGPERRNGYSRPGATQLGYIILTCDQILHPVNEQAKWKLERGIRFYSMI